MFLNRKELIALAGMAAQRMMAHDELTVNRAIWTTYTETGLIALRTAELMGHNRKAVLLQCEERIEEIRAEARAKEVRASVVH